MVARVFWTNHRAKTKQSNLIDTPLKTARRNKGLIPISVEFKTSLDEENRDQHEEKFSPFPACAKKLAPKRLLGIENN